MAAFRGILRFGAGALALAGFALLALFAASNVGLVSLSLWPLPGALDAPAFVVAFAPFVIGALVGGLIVKIRALRDADAKAEALSRARALERENDALIAQLAAFRGAADGAAADGPARPALTPSVVRAFPQR